MTLLSKGRRTNTMGHCNPTDHLHSVFAARLWSTLVAGSYWHGHPKTLVKSKSLSGILPVVISWGVLFDFRFWGNKLCTYTAYRSDRPHIIWGRWGTPIICARDICPKVRTADSAYANSSGVSPDIGTILIFQTVTWWKLQTVHCEIYLWSCNSLCWQWKYYRLFISRQNRSCYRNRQINDHHYANERFVDIYHTNPVPQIIYSPLTKATRLSFAAGPRNHPTLEHLLKTLAKAENIRTQIR